MIEILDDWLDLEFCNHLSEHILYCMPHVYGHTSITGGSRVTDILSGAPSQKFYTVDFGEESFHIKYMCRKLHKEVFQYECQFVRVYANIQFKGMNGSFHKDKADLTVVYMVTPTLEGSGSFEYKDGTEVKKVDFVQNRLIIFEGGDVFHRGMSPDIDSPRVTVAFKVCRGQNAQQSMSYLYDIGYRIRDIERKMSKIINSSA